MKPSPVLDSRTECQRASMIARAIRIALTSSYVVLSPTTCAAADLDLQIVSFAPDTLWSGEKAKIMLTGRGFRPGLQIRLLDSFGSVKAHGETTGEPEQVQAELEISADASGPLDLVVGGSEGAIEFADAFHTARPTYRWGLLIDGKPGRGESGRTESIHEASAIGDCPPPTPPHYDFFRPSVFANPRCPEVAEDLSQTELAFFLIRSNGDTV